MPNSGNSDESREWKLSLVYYAVLLGTDAMVLPGEEVVSSLSAGVMCIQTGDHGWTRIPERRLVENWGDLTGRRMSANERWRI